MPEVNVSRPDPAGSRLDKMNSVKPFHIFSELYALEKTEFQSLNGTAQKTFETILEFLKSGNADEWEENLKLRAASYNTNTNTLLAYLHESEAGNLNTSQVNLDLLSDDNKRATLEDYDVLEKLFNNSEITEHYFKAINDKKQIINEYNLRFQTAINNLCKWVAFFYRERQTEEEIKTIKNKLRISPSSVMALFSQKKQSEKNRAYRIKKEDWANMESLRNIHKIISLYTYSILGNMHALHTSSYELVQNILDDILLPIIELNRHDASRQVLEDNYAEWKNGFQLPIDHHYQLRLKQNEDMKKKLEHVYSEPFKTISTRIETELACITPLKNNADSFFTKLRPTLIFNHNQLADIIANQLFAEQFFNIVIKSIMTNMFSQLNHSDIDQKLDRLKNCFVLNENSALSICFFLPKTKITPGTETQSGELLIESSMLDLFILSAKLLHELRPTKLEYEIKFLNGNENQYQIKCINSGEKLKNTIEFFPKHYGQSVLFIKGIQAINTTEIMDQLKSSLPSKQVNIDYLNNLIESIQNEGKQKKSQSSLFPVKTGEKTQGEKKRFVTL